MRRGFILCLTLASCVAGTVACGDGGAEALSERSPSPSVPTPEARASSGPVVTSWAAQSGLRASSRNEEGKLASRACRS